MKLYEYIMDKVIWCITLAPFMFFLFVCVSCRTVKYIPVESIKHDSVYLNKTIKDSIFVKDSVLIIKGDTITEYRYKYIYQYKVKKDTLYVTKTDSVQVPIQVEQELIQRKNLWFDVSRWFIRIVIIIILIIIVKKQIRTLSK